MNTKAAVEALLFLTRRPLLPETIAFLIKAKSPEVKQALDELAESYEARESAIRIEKRLPDFPGDKFHLEELLRTSGQGEAVFKVLRNGDVGKLSTILKSISRFTFKLSTEIAVKEGLVHRFQNNVQSLCRGDAMRLPGDARHRPYARVHNFGNAVLDLFKSIHHEQICQFRDLPKQLDLEHDQLQITVIHCRRKFALGLAAQKVIETKLQAASKSGDEEQIGELERRLNAKKEQNTLDRNELSLAESHLKKKDVAKQNQTYPLAPGDCNSLISTFYCAASRSWPKHRW